MINLNDQYKADMARHDAWMANSRKQSAEFAETMRQIDADTALAEQILAEQLVFPRGDFAQLARKDERDVLGAPLEGSLVNPVRVFAR